MVVAAAAAAAAVVETFAVASELAETSCSCSCCLLFFLVVAAVAGPPTPFLESTEGNQMPSKEATIYFFTNQYPTKLLSDFALQSGSNNRRTLEVSET